MQEKIKEITYKNQVVDNGIVLGHRLHKGMLRKRYSPLYAMIDNDFVSSVSPHRENCIIYIPVFYLEPDNVIDVYDNGEHLQLIIKEVQNGFVFFKKPEKQEVTEEDFAVVEEDVGF